MKKTILKTIRHRDIVRKNFHRLISKLEERAIVHDLSKLSEDEFDGFVEADELSLHKEYGSPEYQQKIKENKGIALHYKRNSHHPEYYENGSEGFTHFNGIDGMSFLDIVEMVLDWKSACETYGNDFEKSLAYSFERFKCTEQQKWLINLIAKDLN